MNRATDIEILCKADKFGLAAILATLSSSSAEDLDSLCHFLEKLAENFVRETLFHGFHKKGQKNVQTCCIRKPARLVFGINIKPSILRDRFYKAVFERLVKDKLILSYKQKGKNGCFIVTRNSQLTKVSPILVEEFFTNIFSYSALQSIRLDSTSRFAQQIEYQRIMERLELTCDLYSILSQMDFSKESISLSFQSGSQTSYQNTTSLCLVGAIPGIPDQTAVYGLGVINTDKKIDLELVKIEIGKQIATVFENNQDLKRILRECAKNCPYRDGCYLSLIVARPSDYKICVVYVLTFLKNLTRTQQFLDFMAEIRNHLNMNWETSYRIHSSVTIKGIG